jgi:O-antigen/teichoic acid export membrane protein
LRLNIIFNFFGRLKRSHWVKLGSTFLAGQGSIQFLNLLSGFFLLRWLSVEAYAQYSIAFGFQSTLGILVDLGLSGSIIALVGERINDKQVIASYISAAKFFRNGLLILLLPVGVIVFPLITAKHGWSLSIQMLLLGSIISSLFFQGWISFYSPPLLMQKQLRSFYQPQIFSAVLRLFFCFLLFSVSALTSWTTAWVSSLVLAINGSSYKRSSERWISSKSVDDRKARKEMLSYLSPLIPGLIFAAFQGQISLFLITYFGQTQSIAEVAALGRVSQLFLLLSSFNAIIIAPHIAKTPVENLLKNYLTVLIASCLVAVALVSIAVYFPDPLLWLIGEKYSHLRNELSWSILAASLNYVGGVMWAMHSARKWVYWWGTWFYIIILLFTQIIFFLTVDLDSVINVIYFTLASTLSVMLVHIVNAFYGFWKGPREGLRA